MTRIRTLPAGSRRYAYRTTVTTDRPPTAYTARLRSHIEGLAGPLESSWILWQQ